MKTIKEEKTYDAVKTMRKIRDKISAETQDMTYDQFKLYVENRLKNKRLKTIKL